MPTPEQIIRIDGKTLQDSLGELAATMVQKVFREGRPHIAGPPYVSEDIAMLIRYGASVYNLLNRTCRASGTPGGARSVRESPISLSVPKNRFDSVCRYDMQPASGATINLFRFTLCPPGCAVTRSGILCGKYISGSATNRQSESVDLSAFYGD
jgi:hypothetical protein